MQTFSNGHLERAESEFAELARYTSPLAVAAKVYVQRTKELRSQPLPQGWDGALSFTEKVFANVSDPHA
jgi:hypothetical protein